MCLQFAGALFLYPYITSDFAVANKVAKHADFTEEEVFTVQKRGVCTLPLSFQVSSTVPFPDALQKSLCACLFQGAHAEYPEVSLAGVECISDCVV